MIEILKALGEIVSKISLSFSFAPQKQKKENDKAPVNVIVNNFTDKNSPKIGQVIFLNKLENVYTEDVIEELAVKATYINGMVASGIPLEFSIESVYDPIVKNTNSHGIAYFENIKFKKEGRYKLCIKSENDYNYNEVIEVKLNKVCLKFLEQPQSISSKEMLNKVSVNVNYISGTKAEKMLVRIGLNIENVSYSGTNAKITDENGIVYFDNLSLSKTGVYKLKAVCKGEYVYSEPFHVYPPGVNFDFENCDAGSKEETEAFITALLENQSQGDIIKYNGEEF